MCRRSIVCSIVDALQREWEREKNVTKKKCQKKKDVRATLRKSRRVNSRTEYLYTNKKIYRKGDKK